MEVNTPVRIVALLFSIGALSTIFISLVNLIIGFSSPSSVMSLGGVAPLVTVYIYGKKYTKSISKSLRIQSVLLYFCILFLLNIILFSHRISDMKEAIEWGGVSLFIAAGISLTTYFFFWLSQFNYENP